MIDVDALYDWLVDGAPGAAGSADVLQRLGDDLAAAGVRVTRIAAFVRTLHPSVMGRRFVWQRGAAEVEVIAPPHAITATDEYLKSPVNVVTTTGRELRLRLDGSTPFDFEIVEQQRQAGVTDYLCLPLRFLSGETHAVAYSTDARDGFSDEEVAALRTVTRPLARLAEILALRRTATALLDAYVGRDAGERILRGQIQRGHTESIRCVIWFSDLRGFTSMSGGADPADIIVVLNRVFDCQVPAVERHGGEVLKFMGDGMLAIFPTGAIDDARPPAAVCARALAATNDAFAALDALNAERAATRDPPLAFGVSLHLGDVAYGNIGGAVRLDFTAIGPAVNLAARIEGLTGRLGKRLLVSDDFARACTAPLRPVGTFELKGVVGAATVHEPIA
ncbi:MAG TPA: adenylate/guanylate cyclase domain-containing protein [Polyangia bacterium]|jgi:adenylate cyclase|nr:adenylate/guanylate cyclase domain-containing protein [Polyangia bacterium]